MAKKKTKATVKAVASTPTGVIAGNFMEQTGNVIVSYWRNGRKIKQFDQHNTATLKLCTYIRDALYGDYVIAAKPGKIRICELSGATLKPIKNTPFFPQESIDKEKADNSVSIYFKLPHDSVQGRTINGLKLYAANADINDDEYAYVVFGSPLEVTTNVNVRIEWQLITTPKVKEA